MAKTPEFELVEIFDGEEELVSAGTFAQMQEAMAAKIEQADEDIAATGDLAYYPMLRIQPFQGW